MPVGMVLLTSSGQLGRTTIRPILDNTKTREPRARAPKLKIASSAAVEFRPRSVPRLNNPSGHSLRGSGLHQFAEDLDRSLHKRPTNTLLEFIKDHEHTSLLLADIYKVGRRSQDGAHHSAAFTTSCEGSSTILFSLQRP